MIFHFDQHRTPTAGRLLYLEDEGSLFFEEHDALPVMPGMHNRSEITVGPVDLSVDLPTGTLLFASGYAPSSSWKRGQVTPPPHRVGAIRVSGVDAIPGMAVRVDEGVYELTLDADTGWLRVSGHTPTNEALLFAQGTVLGIDSAGHFSGLWMNPEFVG